LMSLPPLSGVDTNFYSCWSCIRFVFTLKSPGDVGSRCPDLVTTLDFHDLLTLVSCSLPTSQPPHRRLYCPGGTLPYGAYTFRRCLSYLYLLRLRVQLNGFFQFAGHANSYREIKFAPIFFFPCFFGFFIHANLPPKTFRP